MGSAVSARLRAAGVRRPRWRLRAGHRDRYACGTRAARRPHAEAGKRVASRAADAGKGHPGAGRSS